MGGTSNLIRKDYLFFRGIICRTCCRIAGICGERGDPARVSAFSVQRSAFSVQRSAFSVQRSAFSVQRSAFGVRRSAFGVRRSGCEPCVWLPGQLRMIDRPYVTSRPGSLPTTGLNNRISRHDNVDRCPARTRPARHRRRSSPGDGAHARALIGCVPPIWYPEKPYPDQAIASTDQVAERTWSDRSSSAATASSSASLAEVGIRMAASSTCDSESEIVSTSRIG
jgi:hypothetical protein